MLQASTTVTVMISGSHGSYGYGGCYNYGGGSYGYITVAILISIFQAMAVVVAMVTEVLFVLGFYAKATVFQSYNGSHLSFLHCSWAGLAFLSG